MKFCLFIDNIYIVIDFPLNENMKIFLKSFMRQRIIICFNRKVLTSILDHKLKGHAQV